jgi:hypothetical protein
MVRERHLSMDKMAKIGGAAYLLGACFATLSRWLSDRWIMSGATPTLVRKTFAGGGLALAGIFLGLSAVSGPIFRRRHCHTGNGVFRRFRFQYLGNYADARGAASFGTMDRFQNFFGNLAGVVAPALTELVLDRTGHFYWAFPILTAVALTGTMSRVFLVGPVEQVVWHKNIRTESVSRQLLIIALA